MSKSNSTTKKSFAGGLSSLLGEQPEKNKGGQSDGATKTSQDNTKENEIRATFIVNEQLLEKMKSIAYWDRVMIKEVINTALEEAASRYEQEHGPIKPIPKK